MIKKDKKKLAKFLNVAGEVLIVMSILGLFLTFGPVISNELTYRTNKARGVKYISDSQVVVGDGAVRRASALAG